MALWLLGSGPLRLWNDCWVWEVLHLCRLCSSLLDGYARSVRGFVFLRAVLLAGFARVGGLESYTVLYDRPIQSYTPIKFRLITPEPETPNPESQHYSFTQEVLKHYRPTIPSALCHNKPRPPSLYADAEQRTRKARSRSLTFGCVLVEELTLTPISRCWAIILPTVRSLTSAIRPSGFLLQHKAAMHGTPEDVTCPQPKKRYAVDIC